MTDPMQKIADQFLETKGTILKIRSLRIIDNPTTSQLEELAMLVSRLNTLCPSYRFKWIDGHPAADIYERLLTEEKEKKNENF